MKIIILVVDTDTLEVNKLKDVISACVPSSPVKTPEHGPVDLSFGPWTKSPATEKPVTDGNSFVQTGPHFLGNLVQVSQTGYNEEKAKKALALMTAVMKALQKKQDTKGSFSIESALDVLSKLKEDENCQPCMVVGSVKCTNVVVMGKMSRKKVSKVPLNRDDFYNGAEYEIGQIKEICRFEAGREKKVLNWDFADLVSRFDSSKEFIYYFAELAPIDG